MLFQLRRGDVVVCGELVKLGPAANEGLLRALKKCEQPFRLGLVISISGGKKGA